MSGEGAGEAVVEIEPACPAKCSLSCPLFLFQASPTATRTLSTSAHDCVRSLYFSKGFY